MTSRLALLFVIAAGCNAGSVGVGDDSASTGSELRLCAGGDKVAGIDVSYYQGTIDWSAVADPTQGNKSFVFIRVGDGLFQDPKFQSYWAGATTAGLYRGAYQYFRASDDPIEQAQLLLSNINNQIGPDELPPVLDLETKDGMSSATVAKNALTWMQYVEAALGRAPLLYTGAGFMSEINNPTSLDEYPLWVANWTTSCPSMPSHFSEWTFWQNRVTSSHVVAGIHGQIDLDYFNGSAQDLANYAGPTGG